MAIQDNISVGEITGRNWGLYAVVAAGLIASLLFVLWWGSGGKEKQPQQQATITPGGQTFETIPLITTPRGYPPPPPPPAPPAPPPPPQVVQQPQVKVIQQAPKTETKPQAPRPPSAPPHKTLGSAFISNEDKEAAKIREEEKKSEADIKKIEEPKTRDENEITTVDDRQGLSQQKNQFLASAGGKGDFFIRKPTDPSLDASPDDINWFQHADKKLIQASTEIQGAMIQGANTDIPGPFFAQVTTPVCDSPTGHYLLIPSGSKFHAIPNNQLSFGQDRIQIAGVRLLFPDGSSQILGSMPAIDASDGAPGSEGEVDHHLLGLAGAVIGSAIFSVVGQAGQLLAGDSQDSGTNPVIIGGQAAGQQTERAGDKLINKQLNRPNTIRKNRGDRITLLIDKDFRLPVRGPCS